MKTIHILFLFLFSFVQISFAQVNVNGTSLKISSGATFYTDMDVVNTANGTITNEGDLIMGAHFVNENGAILTGNGEYFHGRNWLNSATFLAGTSTVTFTGNLNATINPGTAIFNNIVMAKASANISLQADLTIDNQLTFQNDDNKIQLNNRDFIFNDNASVVSYDNNEFFITNGNGEVIKNNLGGTAFTFPVGYNESTYNPVTLTQQGTADNHGVRCRANVLSSGTSGAALTEGVVDASWDISEETAGGSNLEMTTSWTAGDELSDFDRTACAINRYESNWDNLLYDQLGTASNSSPYTRTLTGITEMGVFAVAGDALLDYIEVSPKVYLQGCYSAGQMNDLLRSSSLVPQTEPYTGLSGFTHIGGDEGGESVTAGVLAVTGTQAIVDWVFLELRDKNNSSNVIRTRSALLQRDGDIVELDGVSPVKIDGVISDNYYLVVRHRNHLGVRTANIVSLSRTSLTYDFTTGMSQAYKPGGHPNDPMTVLSGTHYGLWGGNSNGNTNIRYSGPSNDQNQLLNTCLNGSKVGVLVGVYNSCDLNMNGNIRYSGPANDQNFLLNTVLSGSKTQVILQPSF